MDNHTIEGQKTWRLFGRRYFGHLKTEIPTEITVNGQNVQVKIKYKTKRDFEYQMVNGTKELVPVEKDIKAETYAFQKSDISTIEESQRFLWYRIDYVQLVIALVASFFTMGLFLLVGHSMCFSLYAAGIW